MVNRDTILDVGSLRHKAEFQSADQYTLTAANQKIPTWTTYGTYHCSIDAVANSAKHLPIAKSFAATTNTVIVCHYHCEVKPKDRIVYNGRIFKIDGVIIPSEARSKLIIYASESTLSGSN